MTAQCRECQRLVLLTDCEQCGARICGACWARHFERLSGLEFPWPNVWLGVSCENERFYGRVSLLVEMPAVVHYLSIEPMLGDMRDVPLRGIEWVIVGTESGSGARFTDLDWIRRIRDKCKVEGVAFFVKQLTTKGGIKIPFESWPEDLQVREMPGSIVGRSK